MKILSVGGLLQGKAGVKKTILGKTLLFYT